MCAIVAKNVFYYLAGNSNLWFCFVLFSIENKKKTKLVVFLWNECFIEDMIFIELCYCFFWFRNFSHIFDLTICEEAPEETVLLFLRTFFLPFEHFQSLSSVTCGWVWPCLPPPTHSWPGSMTGKKTCPAHYLRKSSAQALSPVIL